ncbi:hypothetical protein J6590_050303 [Homalodisca vitripennis]|nr:hypothetical protein J6590_050303 [Homalodisca vitripennis]
MVTIIALIRLVKERGLWSCPAELKTFKSLSRESWGDENSCFATQNYQESCSNHSNNTAGEAARDVGLRLVARLFGHLCTGERILQTRSIKLHQIVRQHRLEYGDSLRTATDSGACGHIPSQLDIYAFLPVLDTKITFLIPECKYGLGKPVLKPGQG